MDSRLDPIIKDGQRDIDRARTAGGFPSARTARCRRHAPHGRVGISCDDSCWSRPGCACCSRVAARATCGATAKRLTTASATAAATARTRPSTVPPVRGGSAPTAAARATAPRTRMSAKRCATTRKPSAASADFLEAVAVASSRRVPKTMSNLRFESEIGQRFAAARVRISVHESRRRQTRLSIAAGRSVMALQDRRGADSGGSLSLPAPAHIMGLSPA